LLDGRWVVKKVCPVASADLDNTADKAVKELAAMLIRPRLSAVDAIRS
jgi:hypothetical protein